ncbi:MAG TPA: hypothetical protein VLA99_03800 [Nitrospiraceae bacterium]|nr:hypothetical protein [Nitrospiraceae bacterium]
MSVPVTKTVAVCLALGWLILSGTVYPATVPHELHHAKHHAHHHATTHASGLCSWLCAAGQVADGTSAPFAVRLQLADTVDVTHSIDPSIPTLQFFLSRGPPSLFLAV